MANDRLSQLAVEVVVQPTDQKGRLSQLAVEVVVQHPGPTIDNPSAPRAMAVGSSTASWVRGLPQGILGR